MINRLKPSEKLRHETDYVLFLQRVFIFFIPFIFLSPEMTSAEREPYVAPPPIPSRLDLAGYFFELQSVTGKVCAPFAKTFPHFSSLR